MNTSIDRSLAKPARGKLVGLTLLLVGIIGAGVAWFRADGSGLDRESNPVSTDGEPYTASHLPIYSPSTAYSDDYNTFMDRIYNELIRQPEPWSTTDAKFLADVIGTHEYLDHEVKWEDPKTSMQDIETFGLSAITSSLVSNRIANGGGIAPDALRILDSAMVAMLDARNSDARNVAVASTYESGLWIYNPSVRAKLERMAKLDPVLSVRTNIESKFANLELMRKRARWESVRGPLQ